MIAPCVDVRFAEGELEDVIRDLIAAAESLDRKSGGDRLGALPLCQRRVRQLPLAIFVLMGGEWFHKRAEAIPGSQS